MDDVTPKGLLGSVFSGILPPSVKPQLADNVLTIKITEEEFKQIAFRGLDERVKNAFEIRIREGYIEIKVRLI